MTVIDSGEDPRHITLLVLPGAKTEPIIECSDTARKRRSVMLTERLDGPDHARSVEETTMTP